MSKIVLKNEYSRENQYIKNINLNSLEMKEKSIDKEKI